MQLDAEKLRNLVPTVTSWGQLAKHFDLGTSGSRVNILKREVDQLGLSTVHFRKKLTLDEIFVKGRKKVDLRRNLIKDGRPEVCEECGQLPTHNGKPLKLQVDHKDGNNMNQERENLRFLCPNCHSQTPTFAGRNTRAALRGFRQITIVDAARQRLREIEGSSNG